jgi:hypothetical protein
MVKVWIHKRGGTEPFLVIEMSLQDCATQFDLHDAEFMQPLDDGPPSAQKPGPLGDNADPDLVVFEVMPNDQTTVVKPGYYASHMSAGTVQELIGEE